MKKTSIICTVMHAKAMLFSTIILKKHIVNALKKPAILLYTTYYIAYSQFMKVLFALVH